MITVNASNLFAAPLGLYPYGWQIPPEIAADFPKDWVMDKSNQPKVTRCPKHFMIIYLDLSLNFKGKIMSFCQ